MRPEDRGRHVRGVRLLLAACLSVSALVGIQVLVPVAQARPSHADLDAAKAHLNALNQRLDVLVEQYDQAQVALQKAEDELAQAKRRAAAADASAQAASQALSNRASVAYQGVGSELDVLLGSNSISQFSDRLEFL